MTKVEEISIRVGRAVKLRRQELGISQETLAKEAGLHRTYLSDVERGGRNISLHTLERLAKALGLRLGQLVAMAEDSDYEPPSYLKKAGSVPARS